MQAWKERCKCGHNRAAHYNAQANPRVNCERRDPCHYLGKHDMRCQCKKFRPATEQESEPT